MLKNPSVLEFLDVFLRGNMDCKKSSAFFGTEKLACFFLVQKN
jgi:hypothetical protein